MGAGYGATLPPSPILFRKGFLKGFLPFLSAQNNSCRAFHPQNPHSMGDADAVALLKRLSAVQEGEAELGISTACDIGDGDLASVLQLQRDGPQCITYWQELSDAGVVIRNVGR